MSDELRTANIAGAEFAYLEAGRGHPVVLVHGSVSDYRTWTHQVGPFSEAFRVIAYSRRYAHPNIDIPDGVDDQMQPHVEDLFELLTRLDAAPAHLVGHSWGGFVVLLAAIQRPDLVRSITLIEPPVLSLFLEMPPRPAQIASLFLHSPGTTLALLKFGARTVGPAGKAFRQGDDQHGIEIFGQGVMGKEYFARLSAARRQQVWDNRNAGKAQLLGAGFPPLSKEDIRRVERPALIVGGLESPPIFQRLNAALLALLPSAQAAKIAGASHIVQEDAPPAFNEAVLTFLKSV